MRFRVGLSRKFASAAGLALLTPATLAVFSAIPIPLAVAREIGPADPLTEFEKRQGFKASIVTVKRAQELFNRLKHYSSNSDDFQRALTWSRELAKQEINTMKVSLYLTPHFRNEYLWIHRPLLRIRAPRFNQYADRYYVAPVLYVQDPEAGFPVATPMVLDRTFAKKPLTLDEWSHFRMQIRRAAETRASAHGSSGGRIPGRTLTIEDTRCAIVDNYRDYAIPALQDLGPGKSKDREDFVSFQKRHERDQWCVMRIAPMYYVTDVDMQLMDCDPARDPNFTAGFVGKRGRAGAGSEALLKTNGQFNYTCAKGAPVTLTDFRSDIESLH